MNRFKKRNPMLSVWGDPLEQIEIIQLNAHSADNNAPPCNVREKQIHPL